MEGLGQVKFEISDHVIPKYLGRINTSLNDSYHRDIGTISWQQGNIDFSRIESSNNSEQAWGNLLEVCNSDLENFVKELLIEG